MTDHELQTDVHELVTRIDERLKSVQTHFQSLEERVESLKEQGTHFASRIASGKTNIENLGSKIQQLEESVMDCMKAVAEIDKRQTKIEDVSGRHDDRWKTIYKFIMDVVWIILVAYALTKLHLQAPVLP